MTSRERNVSVLARGALALGVNVDKAMIARTAEIVAVTRLIDVPRVRVSRRGAGTRREQGGSMADALRRAGFGK